MSRKFKDLEGFSKTNFESGSRLLIMLLKKKVLLSTRQPPNSRKLLTTAKFVRLPMPKQIKQVGFFPCVKVVLVVTVKVFDMYLFVKIVVFSILDKLKN